MRAAVLQSLSEPAPNGHPAVEIAAKLGLTPATVVTLVEELRLLGYEIEGGPVGYRLTGRPDLLLPEEVQNGLKTVACGRQMVHFPTVGSTNDAARTLARAGAVHGTLVVAETQTKGRGRLGRTWVSPAGAGLWLSLVIRPEAETAVTPLITLVTAVGAVRAIAAVTGLPARIKWPNDIELEGKKVGGILTEAATSGHRLDYAVVGIGLNVNVEEEDFPPELRATATSLRAGLGRRIDRAALVRELLRQLEDLYTALFDHGAAAVLTEWRQLSSTLGREVRVITAQGDLTGRAVDIDTDGALLVATEGGTIVRVTAGEVSLRYQPT